MFQDPDKQKVWTVRRQHEQRPGTLLRIRDADEPRILAQPQTVQPGEVAARVQP